MQNKMNNNMKNKLSNYILIAILLAPSWFLGFKVATIVENLTQTTKLIGNRRMLFYLHPALKLVLTSFIALLILLLIYKITIPIVRLISFKIQNMFHNSFENKSPSEMFTHLGSAFMAFFKFGNWNSKTIVSTVFYLGILSALFPLINMGTLVFNTFRFTSNIHTPFDSPIIGFLIVGSSILALVIWKCFCEILLIILRAIESYYFKTVQPERLSELKS